MTRLGNRSGEMEAFVSAVDTGSFSAAARALSLTPSGVSRIVSRIEARVGVRLLARTTRAVALTPEGDAYYRRCVRILSDMDEAESAAAEAAEPSGRLRVNTSLVIGSHLIAPLLPEFLEKYPRILLDLTLTDDLADLIDDRIDVAIRIGPLGDSALRSRHLGRSRRLVVAAPSYLARRGTPRLPADLRDHNCLSFNFRRSVSPWRFAEEILGRPLAGNTEVSSGEIMRQLALAGVGIARLVEFHIAEDLIAGRLVPLMEDWELADYEELHALWVGRQHLAGRTRAFIDALVDGLRAKLSP